MNSCSCENLQRRGSQPTYIAPGAIHILYPQHQDKKPAIRTIARHITTILVAEECLMVDSLPASSYAAVLKHPLWMQWSLARKFSWNHVFLEVQCGRHASDPRSGNSMNDFRLLYMKDRTRLQMRSWNPNMQEHGLKWGGLQAIHDFMSYWRKLIFGNSCILNIYMCGLELTWFLFWIWNLHCA